MTFVFDLPTTGSCSFNTLLTDPSAGLHTHHLSQATSARNRLRASLKECRRADEQAKDWSAVLIAVQEYIPHLLAITDCVAKDALLLKSEPVFDWRPVLSTRSIKSSARVDLRTLQDDLAACLLTLGLVLYNLAGRQVASLGDYERQRQTSESERKRLDELINSAADMLCRAAGVFTYMSQTLVPNRDRSLGEASRSPLPIDLSQEMTEALSEICLGDAGRLSIRRLMTKAISDMGIAPGHPLPRSHPSPSLLAKLHINVYTLYERACNTFDALAKSSTSSGQVIPELKAYAMEGKKMYRLLAYKWLGVDIGEAGLQMGDAIGWLQLARSMAVELGGKSALTIGKNKVKRKSRVAVELESIDSFLKAYTKVNDKVSFQPITPSTTLMSLVPSGRSAVALKPYGLPEPAFKPTDRSSGSLGAALEGLSVSEQDEGRSAGDSDEEEEQRVDKKRDDSTYALSGGYF